MASAIARLTAALEMARSNLTKAARLGEDTTQGIEAIDKLSSMLAKEKLKDN